MARRTTLPKRTEKPFFGQVQEDLEPVLSIPSGTPDEKQLHFSKY